MKFLLSFASAHGLCFIRLPLPSPMNFLPSYFSPQPHPAEEGSDRAARKAPGVNPAQLFTLKLFKPRGPSEPTPHLAKNSQGWSEQRHVWPALICSSMTHICIQLGWLQIICGMSQEYGLYSPVWPKEIHCAPSLECTACTNFHLIQLL